MSSMTTDQAFELAIQHHNAGRLGEAERIYRQILAVSPQHAGALHFLGVIAYQVGQHEAAVGLIRQALALHPGYAEAYNNLAIVLMEIDRLDEAVDACRSAIRLNPGYAEAYSNMGNILWKQGRFEEAVENCHMAISLKADFADAYNNLGNALNDSGRLEEAEEAYRHAIRLQPNFVKAHINLGAALCGRGCMEEALMMLRKAVALQPDCAEAHCNLGKACRESGLLEEALGAYQKAIQIKPDYAEAHNSLGIALAELGRLEEAVMAYHATIRCQSGYAAAYLNLGNAFREMHRLNDAIDAYHTAISFKEDYAFAYNNLGNALSAAGELDDAVEAFQAAIKYDSEYADAFSNLGNILRDKGLFEEAVSAQRKAMLLNPKGAIVHSNYLFTLLYHPGYDAPFIGKEHREWYRRHGESLKSSIRPHSNDRNPERKLRIGYVSADFREHPIGRFILPLFENHDHREFEIHVYSQVIARDSMTDQIGSKIDVWHSIVGMTDEAVASQIRKDGIDILVDLSMHSGGNRLLVFARKPAPVQITWLAYCAGTGMDTIDYRLSDPFLDPVGMDESVYCEKTWRLPETYWCYQAHPKAPEPSPLPALKNGCITFCCLNIFSKINEAVLELWSQALSAIPDSRLILHARRGSHRERVLDKMESMGVSRQRIEFVGYSKTSAYYEQYHRVDIALDPFPFGGGTTTCDALWMGVPVVTLAGNRAVGRGGVTLLSNAGLPELIAKTKEEYVSIVLGLAGDLPRLNELRNSLRKKMLSSPLMDAPRFAWNMETAFRQMWRAWCEKP